MHAHRCQRFKKIEEHKNKDRYDTITILIIQYMIQFIKSTVENFNENETVS